MTNIRLSIAAACVAGVLGLAPLALAQAPAKQAAPANKGEAVLAAVEVTATVTKIDQATRAVTLKADSGEEYSFVAGSAVKNLAQVHQGDVVKVAYTEALAYEVKKGGKAVAASGTIAGGAAAVGAKPKAAVGGQITATVLIVAIDQHIPSVTVKAASGETRTIKVMRPEKLQGVNVGDTVEITYTEAVAVKVEKAARK